MHKNQCMRHPTPTVQPLPVNLTAFVHLPSGPSGLERKGRHTDHVYGLPTYRQLAAGESEPEQ